MSSYNKATLYEQRMRPWAIASFHMATLTVWQIYMYIAIQWNLWIYITDTFVFWPFFPLLRGCPLSEVKSSYIKTIVKVSIWYIEACLFGGYFYCVPYSECPLSEVPLYICLYIFYIYQYSMGKWTTISRRSQFSINIDYNHTSAIKLWIKPAKIELNWFKLIWCGSTPCTVWTRVSVVSVVVDRLVEVVIEGGSYN